MTTRWSDEQLVVVSFSARRRPDHFEPRPPGSWQEVTVDSLLVKLRLVPLPERRGQ